MIQHPLGMLPIASAILLVSSAMGDAPSDYRGIVLQRGW
jgi:hypothetical protein